MARPSIQHDTATERTGLAGASRIDRRVRAALQIVDLRSHEADLTVRRVAREFNLSHEHLPAREAAGRCRRRPPFGTSPRASGHEAACGHQPKYQRDRFRRRGLDNVTPGPSLQDHVSRGDEHITDMTAKLACA